MEAENNRIDDIEKRRRGRYARRPLNGKTDNLSKLGRWRREKKMKLERLSMLTGVPVSTLSKYCTGQRRPADPRIIECIREVTEGAVTASDWYGLQDGTDGSTEHS